jgi:hypothetical protein
MIDLSTFPRSSASRNSGSRFGSQASASARRRSISWPWALSFFAAFQAGGPLHLPCASLYEYQPPPPTDIRVIVSAGTTEQLDRSVACAIT